VNFGACPKEADGPKHTPISNKLAKPDKPRRDTVIS
jgi:hypothetical protein